MLSRFAAGIIVAFWLLMTGLLIRLEVRPERSRVLNVPAAHVFKQMFAHGQVSSLNIVGNRGAVGRLTLHPKRAPDSGEQLLEFTGSLWLRAPLHPNQRVRWDGSASFDKEGRLGPVELNVAQRDSDLVTSIQWLPESHRAEYQVKRGGHLLRAESLTLDEAGARRALREMEIDESILSAVRGNHQFSAPTIVARQAVLKIRDEEIEAYLLTVRSGETILAELWFSQLGQVLLVKTPFGYSLSAEDISL